MNARSTALRLIEGLQRAQLRIAIGALMAMMAVTVADVLCRYAFARPITGSYDLVEAALLVLVFNGMSAAFLRRRHIVIDVIDGAASDGLRRWLIAAANGLAVVILAMLVWTMLAPAMDAYRFGDRKLELQLPVSVLWALAIAGLAGVTLAALGVLLRPAGGTCGENGE